MEIYPVKAQFRWAVTESNGNTFISDTPLEVGQKTSGSLYVIKVEKIPIEQIKPIIGLGGEKIGERAIPKYELRHDRV